MIEANPCALARIDDISTVLYSISYMTKRERDAIKRLYFFHRYTRPSIARLLGLSRQRINEILEEETMIILNPDLECLVCGREEPPPIRYFIDGNADNKNPQNIIMLCEFDRNIFVHLQIRKRKGVLTAMA